MKSWHVHYMNKYPGGRVHSSEGAVDVYNADGEHCVALRMNGLGVMVDMSEEYGCKDRHDGSPIPKESRRMKLHADGKIGKDDLHDERKPQGEALAKANGGKVPSIAEMEAAAKEAAKAKAAQKK